MVNLSDEIRKNIFACLFSVHNTMTLHAMNKYDKLTVLLSDEDLFGGNNKMIHCL